MVVAVPIQRLKEACLPLSAVFSHLLAALQLGLQRGWQNPVLGGVHGLDGDSQGTEPDVRLPGPWDEVLSGGWCLEPELSPILPHATPA